MDKFLVKLNYLHDILEKKMSYLDQIYNITENQKTVLLSGDTSNETNIFFNGMSREKQILVDEVIKADDIFQKTFSNIKEEFENKGPSYKKQVQELQDAIKKVMDLDIKIRVSEEKNKLMVEKNRPKNKINVPKASKKYVLEQYLKNNKKS